MAHHHRVPWRVYPCWVKAIVILGAILSVGGVIGFLFDSHREFIEITMSLIAGGVLLIVTPVCIIQLTHADYDELHDHLSDRTSETNSYYSTHSSDSEYFSHS